MKRKQPRKGKGKGKHLLIKLIRVVSSASFPRKDKWRELVPNLRFGLKRKVI